MLKKNCKFFAANLLLYNKLRQHAECSMFRGPKDSNSLANISWLFFQELLFIERKFFLKQK
jgi:hypothetical protein